MPLRPKVALALALVALAIPQGCDVNPPRDLNPQPIPPNGASEPATPTSNADAGSGNGLTQPPSSSGASSNGGAGSGSSSGASTGSGSGAKTGSSSGSPTTSSSGGSGGTSSTGTSDAGSEDAGEPASDSGSDASGLEDAASDGESGDGSPSDAGEDAQSDAGCWVNSDCPASFPDVCNICAWPLNRLVCVSNACVCACRVTYDSGD